jgi:hypothetical protein
MESESFYPIGILFDNDTYIHKLIKYSSLNLVLLPVSFTISLKSNSLIPKPFSITNKIVNVIILYSHFKVTHRAYNSGLEWVKTFRLRCFNTPIIVLTWQPTEIIEKKYGRGNPFIITNKQNAFKILQLPVRLNEMEETIEIISPLTDKEFKNQLEQLKEWEIGIIKHDLINILRASEDILDMKKRILNYMRAGSRQKEYNSFYQELLTCSNTKMLEDNIQSFK